MVLGSGASAHPEVVSLPLAGRWAPSAELSAKSRSGGEPLRQSQQDRLCRASPAPAWCMGTRASAPSRHPTRAPPRYETPEQQQSSPCPAAGQQSPRSARLRPRLPARSRPRPCPAAPSQPRARRAVKTKGRGATGLLSGSLCVRDFFFKFSLFFLTSQ